MKVVGIVFTLICFCLLILGHEFGHFSVGKLLGFKINEFAVGMGPKLWSKKKGETEYSLRAVPIGGFCAFEGEDDGSEDPRAFNRQKPWKKILVLIAGSFNNIVIGIIIFTVIFTVMGSYSPVLDEVFEGKPAAQAGIQAGDRIVAVNGKEYENWTDITNAISTAKEDVLDIGVTRNGQRLDFKVGTYATEQGTKAIGIKCSVEHSLAKAVKSAFGECGTMVRSLRDFFGRLFKGQASSDDVGSIIKIVAISGEYAEQYGLLTVIYLIALVSVNLGFMNMLPIPALDGGRLLFVIIRWITRGKLPEKVENIINGVFMVLLLALMVFLMLKDVIGLFK